MTANVPIARDDIQSFFTVAWKAQSPALNTGVAPVLRYDGVVYTTPLPDAPWLKVTIRHTNARQGSLADPTGRKRWENTGLLIVQVHTPQIAKGGGLILAEALANLAKVILQGKATPNGVWFRNVRATEGGPSDNWYLFTVFAEFTYDEVV